jgi:hypothetical protein
MRWWQVVSMWLFQGMQIRPAGVRRTLSFPVLIQQ